MVILHNRSGWKGESRRHSLARKGIKTGKANGGYAKGQEMTPTEHPYFNLDKHDIPNVIEFMVNTDYWNEKRDMDYKIVWMPVEEYEKAIEKGFNKDLFWSGKEQLDYPIRDRITGEHLAKIMDIMESNKMPMPFISYWVHNKFEEPSYKKINFGQEGHHRAVASGELGEPIIPVVVIYPINKWEDYGKGYMTPFIRGELYE